MEEEEEVKMSIKIKEMWKGSDSKIPFPFDQPGLEIKLEEQLI